MEWWLRATSMVIVLIGFAKTGAAVEAQDASMIGQPFWLNPDPGMTVDVCLTPHKPRGNEKDCPEAAWGKFVITKVVTGDDGQEFFEIEIKAGRHRGYILLRDKVYFAKYDPQDPKNRERKAADQCARRGQPRIGMSTAEAAATCWGTPHHVNRTVLPGHTHEQHVYDRNRYLYFQDGVLTSIQESVY